MSDVFISYAREDHAFVVRLYTYFEMRKRDAWIDTEKIPGAAKWFEEVKRGIDGAASFLFVISEDSLESRHCKTELAHAVTGNKRIVPLWHRDVDYDAVPPELAAHNYIYMRDRDDFDKKFEELVEILDTDLEWLRQHTRLLVRATEWENKGRDRSYLLRGRDLRAAEALLRQDAQSKKDPELAPVQKEYVKASRKATTRVQQAALGTAVCFLIVVVLAAYAWSQRNDANLQRNKAEARGFAGQAELMSDQGGQSLPTATLLAAEAKRELSEQHLPSLVADGVLRNGVTLLARPGPRLEHENRVYAVDYSPDGKYVATASDDKTARVWDARSGEEVGPPLESGAGLSNVIFSPNSRYLATSSTDGTARVYQVPSGEEKAKFEHGAVMSGSGQPKIDFSLDSKYLATTDGQDEEAYVWSVADDKQPVAHFGLPGPGSRVVFGRNQRLAAVSDNVLQVWDLRTRRQVAPSVEQDSTISAVAFSPDGKYVATASDDGTARVWDAESDEVSRVEHDNRLSDLAFGPSGNRLATASYDGTARVWDVQSGEGIAAFEHDSTVTDLDFNPDGTQLATVSLDNAHVWDVATGQEVARMPHLDQVSRVDFDPDGEHVATASYDHTGRIWEVADGDVTNVAHDEGSVNSVSFDRHSRYLATAGSDNTARVWDIRSGDEITRVEHLDGVDGVTFSPDGKSIATASSDNTARVWVIATGKQTARMGHEAAVSGGITFSPKGRYLATASADGKAHVWDVATGKEKHSFQHTIYGGAYSAAFSPDGKRLATAGAEPIVRVWDIATGKVVEQVAPQMAHDQQIWEVAFSPNGKYLALAGMDGTVWLWSFASENIVGEPMRHQGPVESLKFSPGSKYLATASYDHTARVWKVPSGEEVARLNHDDSLNGVAFSPHGDRVATAGADGIARIEPWRPIGLVHEACTHLALNLSEGEWRQHVGGPYQPTCRGLPIPQASSTDLVPVHASSLTWENGGPIHSRLVGEEEQTGLESVRASHTAVAESDACHNKVTYEPKNAADGEPTTAWRVGGTGKGEWIELRYDKPISVSRVGIIPGYAKIDPCDGTDRFYQNYVIKSARIEFSDGSSVTESYQQKPQMQFSDVTDTETSFIRVTLLDTYPPATNAPYAAPYSATVETASVSEIKVEGG